MADNEDDKVKLIPKFFLFKNSTHSVFIRDIKRFGITETVNESISYNITIDHFDNSTSVISYKNEKVCKDEYITFLEWLVDNGVELTNKTL